MQPDAPRANPCDFVRRGLEDDIVTVHTIYGAEDASAAADAAFKYAVHLRWAIDPGNHDDVIYQIAQILKRLSRERDRETGRGVR